MSSTSFLVMLLLPSFAFAFLVLAALYGVGRAYLALSWVPVALFAATRILEPMSKYQPSAINWAELSEAVAWAGLAQCCLGVALAARAVWLKQGYPGLLLAACLAVVPCVLNARD